MKIKIILFITFLFINVNTLSFAVPYNDALQHWSSILEKFVDNEGRTDFFAIKNERSELDLFIEYIAYTSPENNPNLFPTKADVLAYHLNAYNALAMHSVLEKNVPKGFNSFFKRVGFFKLHKIQIGGNSTSLYDYENRVIRPIGDARIHFALNCMVKDCPRLPREPFIAKDLDKQLDEVTREFFSKDKHIRLDHDKRILWVSEILKFYTKDFVASGRSQDLIGYINQYLEKQVPKDYKLRFISYDWTLNQQ